MTTANKDAGPAIYGSVPDLPPSFYSLVLNETFGPQATQILMASPFYPPPVDDGSDTDIRPDLVTLGTDQIWRCPTWTFARNWSTFGGHIYVGVFTEGATYPTNLGFSICTEPGNVCHQDDIEIVVSSLVSYNGTI